MRIVGRRFSPCANHEFCDLFLRRGCSDEGFIVRLLWFGFSWFKAKSQAVDHSRTVPAILKVKVCDEQIHSFEFRFLDFQEGAISPQCQRRSVCGDHLSVSALLGHNEETNRNSGIYEGDDQDSPIRNGGPLIPFLLSVLFFVGGAGLNYLYWSRLYDDGKGWRCFTGLTVSFMAMGVGLVLMFFAASAYVGHGA